MWPYGPTHPRSSSMARGPILYMVACALGRAHPERSRLCLSCALFGQSESAARSFAGASSRLQLAPFAARPIARPLHTAGGGAPRGPAKPPLRTTLVRRRVCAWRRSTSSGSSPLEMDPASLQGARLLSRRVGSGRSRIGSIDSGCTGAHLLHFDQVEHGYLRSCLCPSPNVML